MFSLTDLDLGWLAGLLEGEGCFDRILRKNGQGNGPYAYTRIRLQMADEDVVRRAADLMGGNRVRSYARPDRPEHKPMWRTEVRGSRAEEILQALYPHMGKRRSEKIDEVLDGP